MTTEPEPLTDREKQVLAELLTDVPIKAIGPNMGISPKTVQNHLSSAYHKLGAHTRVEALRQAFKRGLLDVRQWVGKEAL